NGVGERRHRSAVDAGYEDRVDILIRGAALEAGIVSASREIVWPDRLIFAVGERSRRRTISLALRTVALPALEFGKESLAMGDALDGDRWFSGNLDGLASLFLFPPRRECLDVRDQVSALLIGKSIPDRHKGIRHTAPEGIEQVLVSGQRTGGSRAAFEGGDGEITGLRIQPLCVLAVAISLVAVAAGAVAAVVHLAVLGVAGHMANVTLHGW